MTDTGTFSAAALLMLFFLGACSGQTDRVQDPAENAGNQQPSDGQAVLTFDALSHDFGTILEGERVVGYFDYMNTGDGDLVISSVEATCGCTTPGWNREPLEPGARETLKVVFDSSGRSGVQQKSVSVLSNASNGWVRLTISADIRTL